MFPFIKPAMSVYETCMASSALYVARETGKAVILLDRSIKCKKLTPSPPPPLPPSFNLTDHMIVALQINKNKKKRDVHKISKFMEVQYSLSTIQLFPREDILSWLFLHTFTVARICHFLSLSVACDIKTSISARSHNITKKVKFLRLMSRCPLLVVKNKKRTE